MLLGLPVVVALGKWKNEDQKFKSILGYRGKKEGDEKEEREGDFTSSAITKTVTKH